MDMKIVVSCWKNWLNFFYRYIDRYKGKIVK